MIRSYLLSLFNLRRRSWYVLFGIFVLIGCVLMIQAPWRNVHATESAPTSSKPALTISVVKAVMHQFDDQLEVSGSLVPWQEATVSASATGLRIDELVADVGETVHKGQVLAKYNLSGLKALEAQNLATVAHDHALFIEAHANNQRALSLKNTGALSEQDGLKFATSEATAKAQLELSQATLLAVQIQIRDATVVAPDDGIITARSANLGAISASGQEMFRMIRKGRIEWRAQLTPEQAIKVMPGKLAQLVLPDGAQVNGRVRLVSPTIDVTTRLATAYVDLDKSSLPHAGMYVTGKIKLGTQQVPGVPATSVVVRDGTSYIFLVKHFGGATTVQRHKVEVGQTEQQTVAILNGIAPGDEVANLGAGFLEDGDVVRIATYSPTP